MVNRILKLYQPFALCINLTYFLPEWCCYLLGRVGVDQVIVSEQANKHGDNFLVCYGS